MDSILNLATRKHILFAQLQEAVLKDIERAFGVRQAMWHIVTSPSRFNSVETMRKVMQTVVSLHKVVVEEREWEAGMECEDFTEGFVVRNGTPPMWEGLIL